MTSSYVIDLKPLVKHISDSDLERLSAKNPELKFETNTAGNLIVMSPTGSLTSEKNGDLFAQIWNWNHKYKLGKVFDSSGGFKLSNNSIRSPDVSWMGLSKWNSLTDKQKRGFAPIDPDFVLELMSHPPLSPLIGGMKGGLQQKMAEYMTCDIKLGWLINPDEKQVEIYRIGQDKEVLDNPSSLSGENIMPNLIVDLSDIF